MSKIQIQILIFYHYNNKIFLISKFKMHLKSLKFINKRKKQNNKIKKNNFKISKIQFKINFKMYKDLLLILKISI